MVTAIYDGQCTHSDWAILFVKSCGLSHLIEFSLDKIYKYKYFKRNETFTKTSISDLDTTDFGQDDFVMILIFILYS